MVAVSSSLSLSVSVGGGGGGERGQQCSCGCFRNRWDVSRDDSDSLSLPNLFIHRPYPVTVVPVPVFPLGLGRWLLLRRGAPREPRVLLDLCVFWWVVSG